MKRKVNQKGFTLIELLVIIGIISILAATVIVALNPVARFADSRNSRRWSDINSIQTAIAQYIVDNDGALPTGLSTSMSETQLGSCTTGGATLCSGAAASCVDLSTPLATYLKSLPTDPDAGTAATTGYSVAIDANNIVTISACGAESGETIQLSR